MVARLKRLEEHYESYGMRRTCEGILVCHEHNHPHVLMLQIANAFFKLYVFFLLELWPRSSIGDADFDADTIPTCLQTWGLSSARCRRDRRVQNTLERQAGTGKC